MVSELRGGPNSSCPLNWSHPFSATDFDGDGQLDVVGMRRTDSFYTRLGSAGVPSKLRWIRGNESGRVPFPHSTVSTIVNHWWGGSMKPTERYNMCV